MRQYETICIVNPDLADEDYKAALAKSRELIEKQKGVIVKVQEWGKQRLAYLVKNYDKGSYVIFNYCGNSGVSAELERNLKLDDRFLKFMTVKLEDQVDPEALLQKEREAQEQSSPPAEETETASEGGEDEDTKPVEGDDNE
jgi:small subunit ribosomal protein S6